jgi:hypothetical protein
MPNSRSELEGVKSYRPKMECICPVCRKKHVVSMRWAGKGIPKKFCRCCKRVVASQ